MTSARGSATSPSVDSRVRILVNGQCEDVGAGTALAELVGAVVGDARGVAVAVDREVVPRSRWNAFVLREGMHVEVVSAAAGG